MRDLTPLEERILTVVGAHLAVERTVLQPQARLDVDLGLDSLARLDLAMRLEDDLDVALPDDAVTEPVTVGELVEAVRGALDGVSPGGGQSPRR